MKQCHICGTANSNNASFCASCGSALGGDSYESVTYPAYSGNSTLTSEEREVIEGMKRNFRREKKSFKIISIIGIVCMSIYACFVLLFAVLFILAGSTGTWSTYSSLNLASVDPGTAGTYVVSLAMIIYCIVYLVMLLPVFIVGLVAAKKIDYYLTTIDNDIEPSRKRATAVGMIVFSAIFNNIAMIFVILNFVYAKRNAKVIESIINKQHLQNPHLG